jgi:hypothetical protein
LLKFARLLYSDYSQLINLMPTHQRRLSNEIESLVNRRVHGGAELVGAVRGDAILSSSPKTIETNGVNREKSKGLGNETKVDWLRLRKLGDKREKFQKGLSVRGLDMLNAMELMGGGNVCGF